MSRVAVKNEMIARRTTKVVVVHGLVTGIASRLRAVYHSPLLPHQRLRVPCRSGTLQHLGVQRSERSFLMQPLGTMTLRAICCVRLLVKGMAINFHPLPNPLPEGEGAIALSPSGGKLERGLAFLTSHPAKPLSRPCGT